MRSTRRLLLLLAALAPIAPTPARAQSAGNASLTRDGRAPFAPSGTTRQTERVRRFDVKHTKLELALDVAGSALSGTVTHTLTPLHEKLATVELDCGPALKVAGVTLSPGGAECKFEHVGSLLRITLDRAYEPGEVISLGIRYGGSPRRGIYFIPPDPVAGTKSTTVWTQGEPDETHEWLPCYAYPNDRGTSETIVTVPSPLVVVSNGALVEQKENGDGTTTFHWKLDVPHVSYLISLAAGDFRVLRDKAGDVPVESYTDRSIDEAAARRALGNAPKMIAFFGERLGVPYPYPKYAQVSVPEFTWGGMENISATTLNDMTFRDEVAALEGDSDGLVAHELAHQWFGDLVTCREWSQLWLNEGFASYFDPLYAEHARGEDAFRVEMLGVLRSYLDTDGRYRRPIVEPRYDDVRKLFDGVTYAKGACVLHALRGVLGEEAWWAGIQRYLKENRENVVSTDDFRKAMEATSGQSLGWFFDQWVSKAGHPELKARWRYEKADKTVRVRVEQAQAADDATPLFRLPTTLEIVGDDERPRTVPVVIERAASQEFILPADSAPRMVWIDPEGWIPKTLEFDKPPAEWIYQLEHERGVVGRLYAARALAPSKDNAEAARALAAAIGREKEPAARRRMVEYLHGNAASHRDALLAAAKDEDATVRREAFGGLARLDRSEELETLFRGAWGNPKEAYGVRANALRGLARWEVADRDDLLRAALDVRSYRDAISFAVLDAVGNRNSPLARECVVACSRPGHTTDLRERAVRMLGRLAKDDSAAEDALIDLVADRDARVRGAAWDALGGLKRPKALPALEARRAAEVEGRARLDAAIAALQDKPAGAKEKDGAADHGREAAELESKAVELELQARELRNKAESLRLKDERDRRKSGGPG